MNHNPGDLPGDPPRGPPGCPLGAPKGASPGYPPKEPQEIPLSGPQFIFVPRLLMTQGLVQSRMLSSRALSPVQGLCSVTQSLASCFHGSSRPNRLGDALMNLMNFCRFWGGGKNRAPLKSG